MCMAHCRCLRVTCPRTTPHQSERLWRGHLAILGAMPLRSCTASRAAAPCELQPPVDCSMCLVRLHPCTIAIPCRAFCAFRHAAPCMLAAPCVGAAPCVDASCRALDEPHKMMSPSSCRAHHPYKMMSPTSSCRDDVGLNLPTRDDEPCRDDEPTRLIIPCMMSLVGS